jgi:hypothetical protein
VAGKQAQPRELRGAVQAAPLRLISPTRTCSGGQSAYFRLENKGREGANAAAEPPGKGRRPDEPVSRSVPGEELQERSCLNC